MQALETYMNTKNSRKITITPRLLDQQHQYPTFDDMMIDSMHASEDRAVRNFMSSVDWSDPRLQAAL